MGFQSTLTVITTYFQDLADLHSWPVCYDNDPRETPDSGLWTVFKLDWEESEQKEIGNTNSRRNFGNVIIEVRNDAGLGIGGILAEVDLVAAAFRFTIVGTIIFKVPNVIKIGRVDDNYQINVVCPFYIDT